MSGLWVDMAIGAGLGLIVAFASSLTGFDRDKSFYPTVLIVIAFYYVLFAFLAPGADGVLESAIALVFAAAAVVGFRSSLWGVAAVLAAHGLFDLWHEQLVANPGVPLWWPGFCAGADFALSAWLAGLLVRRRRSTS